MRKENVMLNDEYNKIVNDKTRYEVEYKLMKKRLDELENIDENENVESFDVFVELIRNTSSFINNLTQDDELTRRKSLIICTFYCY
jgi:chaperonin cofactor prefoldin